MCGSIDFMRVDIKRVFVGIIVGVALLGFGIWGWYFPGVLKERVPLLPDAYCRKFRYFGDFDPRTQILQRCPFGCVAPRAERWGAERLGKGFGRLSVREGMLAPPPKMCRGW